MALLTGGMRFLILVTALALMMVKTVASHPGAKRISFPTPPPFAPFGAEPIAPAGNKSLLMSTGMRTELSNRWYTRAQLEAGAFAESFDSSSRIIRGKNVFGAARAPYVGSLHTSPFGFFYSFTCTCIVVDKKIILTAAHCVPENSGVMVCVSSIKEGEGRCFDVVDGYIPDEYLTAGLNGEGDPWTHDLALLKTAGNMLDCCSKARVIPIDLAKKDVPTWNQRGYVYGFGNKDEASTQNDGKLRILDVVFKAFTSCYPDESTIRGKNFLCSDGNYDGSRGGSCNGDSGGPLVWSTNGTEDPSTHVLVGVASFVFLNLDLSPFACSVTDPSGYAWTASWEHTTWLQYVMKEKLNGKFTVYSA